MITGIQITQANNPQLLNSFWLLDSENAQARCLCAKGDYAEDQVVAVSELGEVTWREIPLEQKPEVRIAVPDNELHARREEEEARGEAAYTPHNRVRQVSFALRAYASLATSADKGAVRDKSKLGG